MIGILGGMGPAATVDFLQKMVAATPAHTDQEHVPLIIYDVPQIPSRVDAILKGNDGPYLPMLAGVRMLERAGAEAIAIVCNTAHFWYDRLAGETGVPILHIAEAVAHAVRTGPPITSLGIAATRGTLAARVYDEHLASAVPNLILPDEMTQQMIDQTIAAVKAGNQMMAADLADGLAQRLAEMGAQRILLGCTELPIAFRESHWMSRCIDATGALAGRCVAYSMASPPGRPNQHEHEWICAGSKTS